MSPDENFARNKRTVRELWISALKPRDWGLAGLETSAQHEHLSISAVAHARRGRLIKFLGSGHQRCLDRLHWLRLTHNHHRGCIPQACKSGSLGAFLPTRKAQATHVVHAAERPLSTMSNPPLTSEPEIVRTVGVLLQFSASMYETSIGFKRCYQDYRYSTVVSDMQKMTAT